MNCETCDDAGGFCEVHGIEKSRGLVRYCKTRPEVRKAWDEGRGLKQGNPPAKRKHKERAEPPGADRIREILDVLCPGCPSGDYDAEEEICYGVTCPNGRPIAQIVMSGNGPKHH